MAPTMGRREHSQGGLTGNPASKGNYPAGQRLQDRMPAFEDFAAGQRRLWTPAGKPDFAEGQRTLRRGPERPDFARGQHH